jgi:hypothetical protein
MFCFYKKIKLGVILPIVYSLFERCNKNLTSEHFLKMKSMI